MAQWWVFAHVAGVLAFLATHGVSMAVLFKLRTERDPKAVANLLGLSSASLAWFYWALGLLLAGGIGAAFALRLWGRAWLWVSIGILVAVALAMYAMASPYYRRVRLISRAMADGSEAVSPAQFDQVLRSGRPTAVAAIGAVGLLAILYLMVFQPSFGTDSTGEASVPGGSATGPDLTVAAENTRFAPTSLAAPAGSVTVTLVNRDSVLHDFTVDELGVKVVSDAERTNSGTFPARPGTFEFYCSVPGHKAAGMVGTLTVARGGRSP